MEQGVNGSSAGIDVDGCVNDLTSSFDLWKKAMGGSNKKLLDIMAGTFVVCYRLRDDESMFKAIVERAAALAAQKEIRGWSAKGKSIPVVLLALISEFDQEHAQSRSQWARSLDGALSIADLEPTKEAFLAKAKVVGGLKGFAALLNGNSASNDSLESRVEQIRRLPKAPADSEIGLGLSFTLNDSASAEPIVYQSADPNLLKHLLGTVLNHAKQQRARSEAEKVAIRALNDFALTVARAPGSIEKLTAQAVDAFSKAHHKLASDPIWMLRYGLAGTSIVPEVDGNGRRGFKVANPEFDPWDPARFINNAKPGVLVAYSLEGDDQDRERALQAYLSPPKNSKGEAEADLTLDEDEAPVDQDDLAEDPATSETKAPELSDV